jgi:hypothetical protein
MQSKNVTAHGIQLAHLAPTPEFTHPVPCRHTYAAVARCHALSPLVAERIKEEKSEVIEE